jgi:hypothetical protein
MPKQVRVHLRADVTADCFADLVADGVGRFWATISAREESGATSRSQPGPEFGQIMLDQLDSLDWQRPLYGLLVFHRVGADDDQHLIAERDEVLCEVELRHVFEPSLDHLQDFDLNGRLRFDRALVSLGVAISLLHQCFRQQEEGIQFLRIAELPQTCLVLFGQTRLADIEAANDRCHAVEINLVHLNMMPSETLEGYGEVIDGVCNPAVALDQEAQDLLEWLDLDEIPE